MGNWIWYPGDFELYHSLCQNFDREERGFFWPANWKSAQFNHCVRFSYDYVLEEDTEMRVTALGKGYVNLRVAAEPPAWLPKERLVGGVYYEETKRSLSGVIRCPAGKGGIDIILCDVAAFPCVLVEGDVIQSGMGWTACDQAHAPAKAGWNAMYTESSQDPRRFEYTSELVQAVRTEEVNGGLLFDFGRELTAETVIEFPETAGRPERLTLCYGESRTEALDVEFCYLKQTVGKDGVGGGQAGGTADPFGGFEAPLCYRTRLRAFRYIFIPEGKAAGQIKLTADYKYVDFPVRASFSCPDGRVNRIWEVADITFRLASGIFFLDGIKRDRYIWSGDAYQSYFINQYLFFDEDICKRTILALRGNDPVAQHINGILDYSMYWLISLENYYRMTADCEFLEMAYPKMETMIEYLEQQVNEEGLIYGRPGDWVFVDWADLDKDGPIAAEQFLLARSYQAMAACRKVLGMDGGGFEEKEKTLLATIRRCYWDAEQGAFIDSYTSGRRKVSRHPNIFAVLFGFADEAETASILKNVLFNDKVSAITTPYFKFYELEALAMLGQFEPVMESMKSYWGGMLDRGADTFWEEFKPDEPEEEQYGMYGDPYGKSLCHAWGASPIYLIGRYVMGLRPTAPGYASFEVSPQLSVFPEFSAALPVKGGSLKLEWKAGTLTVLASRDGGTLILNGEAYTLPAGKAVSVKAR